MPDRRTAQLPVPESLFNAIQRCAELEESVGIRFAARMIPVIVDMGAPDVMCASYMI